jgi:hypothetical protein
MGKLGLRVGALSRAGDRATRGIEGVVIGRVDYLLWMV